MSNKTLPLDTALYDYLLQHSLREPDVLRELRSATMALPESNMQIAPEQGQFMALLVELTGARRILEIGSFTGYSTLWMGLALPDDGRIVACDLNREWTDIAARYWRRAGVRQRIDLRIGPALETLDGLLDDGEANGFDLAFVDADKSNYLNYYERCLQLLRRGALLLFDNVLWDGKVADPEVQDADTVTIRELNRTLHRDQRVSLSLVPIGDGLTLARKR